MGFPNMESSQILIIMDLFSIIFISFRKKKQSPSLLRPGWKVYISLKIGWNDQDNFFMLSEI